MSLGPACEDPQEGDSVTKGKRTRIVVSRDGNAVFYKVAGCTKQFECFITTWRQWCINADSCMTVGQEDRESAMKE